LKNTPKEWPDRFKQSSEEVKSFDKRAVECFLIFESVVVVDKLISHFSSHYMLKRAVVWLTKFKQYLQNPSEFNLTVKQLQDAELDLVSYSKFKVLMNL